MDQGILGRREGEPQVLRGGRQKLLSRKKWDKQSLRMNRDEGQLWLMEQAEKKDHKYLRRSRGVRERLFERFLVLGLWEHLHWFLSSNNPFTREGLLYMVEANAGLQL